MLYICKTVYYIRHYDFFYLEGVDKSYYVDKYIFPLRNQL